METFIDIFEYTYKHMNEHVYTRNNERLHICICILQVEIDYIYNTLALYVNTCIYRNVFKCMYVFK
jgi:hypothetical protein